MNNLDDPDGTMAFLKEKEGRLFKKRNMLKEVNIFKDLDPKIFRSKPVKIAKNSKLP